MFYEVWNEPLYTIGGRHLISEAIALCGGENVFAALTLPAPSVTIEAVVAAAPDVIVGGDDSRQAPAVARRLEALAGACLPCATAISSAPTAISCTGRGRVSSKAWRRCARISRRRARAVGR